MEAAIKSQMSPGRLYVCEHDVRVKGRLADGREAFSILVQGTPVIALHGKCGEEAIMADGAIIAFTWGTPGWQTLFLDVSGSQESSLS